MASAGKHGDRGLIGGSCFLTYIPHLAYPIAIYIYSVATYSFYSITAYSLYRVTAYSGATYSPSGASYDKESRIGRNR